MTGSVSGAPWFAAPPLQGVLAALNGDGEETRIVGGAVRDALLGLPVVEVDLATTALPQEVERRAVLAGFKAVPTGIAHGTVTVVAQGTPFEVTTLREDVETDGRHAQVRFGRDWRRDAERRDFTMNALYATQAGDVVDLVGGLADLAARRVRFIGDAQSRIREDYLRILRLFRFHARFGAGPLDAQALRAAVREREGLRRLSRERLRAELLKLLAAPSAPEVIRVMSENGLLQIVLGTVADLAALDRLAVLEGDLALPADALRRLGALAVRIAEDAARLRERLRLANAEGTRLAALTPADVGTDLTPAAARARLYGLGREAFVDRLLIKAARSNADGAQVRPLLGLAQTWERPVSPFRAADLIARGIPPGPRLGALLAQAEAAWIAADFPPAPAARAAILETLLEGHGPRV